MTDCFKGVICLPLVLVLQLMVLPLLTPAYAEAETTPEAAEAVLSQEVARVDPAAGETAAQDIDQPETSAETQVDDGGGLPRIAEGIAAPRYQSLAELIGSPEISVLANIDGHFVKSLSDTQLVGESASPGLGDTNLQSSIWAGRTFSRDSLAARQRTFQAEAQTGQALALLLPSATLRASSGIERSRPSVEIDEETGKLIDSDIHDRTDISFTIRQAIFDLPRYFDWTRRKVVEEAREESYRVSDGDAYISTVTSYLTLVSSRLQTDMLRDFENQLAELLIYIEKRADAGAASVSDMARVSARSEETLSTRLEQESAHAAAWVEFVQQTNLVPQRVNLPETKDVGGGVLPESFELAVPVAMEMNPEISALTAELKAARINKTAAKSRYLPRLDAEYTFTYSLHAGGEPSNAGQKDQRIMAVLNWDIFNGGRDYQFNAERSARHKELLYRLDDQRRRVIQSISANYALLATTRARISSGYLELKSISTAAQAMSKRMLSGNQSLLDLLDVYDRLYQARSRLVRLHVLEMNTVSQLVRLTRGTPWTAEQDGPMIESKRDQVALSVN
ncbi:MAG: TolC family protein [Desulfuromonadales bacterium]|nr:TolC family protein [Desulfuromonadales bacterium]